MGFNGDSMGLMVSFSGLTWFIVVNPIQITIFVG
jgi:hypothetical protein